jgi:tetratricopeptide (TPR) repeat protein
VPRLTTTSSDIAPAGQTVLFHEYAHHVMEGVSERAYPRWFVEGFAEYFSETRFMPDGSLGFGVPATDRVKELAYVGAVPMRRLLDLDGGGVAQKPAYGSFYATSWALFHYLQTDASRVGQLRDYERRLANGEPPLAAAEGAFGDLDALGRDMLAYVNKGLMMMIVVDRKALPVGVIQVRRLRPGEAAMMPVVIESKVGVDREEALALLPEARKVAMQFADDSAVLAALAEAEHDAGNDEEAIAAADKALGLDPRQINAHIQKGYALTRKAQDGEQPEAAWKVARSQWVKANKAENDHPVPLVQFYLSFVDQGERPTPTAVQGLEWALQLAPFDPNLRWRVVQQMIQDERYAEAAGVLSPLAYSPHPGEFTDRARTLLQEVEAKAGGDSSSVPAPVTVD